MENKRDITVELKEIDAKIELALELQEFYGEEYQRKLRELEAEYHQNIITTNRGIVEQHMRRNEILGKKTYIITARYLNCLDQECDTDALWLSPIKPKIGQSVRLFDNIVHGIGDYSGVIMSMYERPNSKNENITMAVPFHYKPYWHVNYNGKVEEDEEI